MNLFKQNIVICKTCDKLDDVLGRFKNSGLPEPVVFDGSIQSNLSNIYQYATDNKLTYVTIFSSDAYPCKNILEKFDELESLIPKDWDILSWCRRGEVSGWHPANLNHLWSCGYGEIIGPRISPSIKSINDKFISIDAYTFGDDCFTIKTEVIPLFLDIVNYYGVLDICLSSAPYEGFINVYHSKELLVCKFAENKWYFPLNYNDKSNQYRCGFYNRHGSDIPPIDFQI